MTNQDISTLSDCELCMLRPLGDRDVNMVESEECDLGALFLSRSNAPVLCQSLQLNREKTLTVLGGSDDLKTKQIRLLFKTNFIPATSSYAGLAGAVKDAKSKGFGISDLTFKLFLKKILSIDFSKHLENCPEPPPRSECVSDPSESREKRPLSPSGADDLHRSMKKMKITPSLTERDQSQSYESESILVFAEVSKPGWKQKLTLEHLPVFEKLISQMGNSMFVLGIFLVGMEATEEIINNAGSFADNYTLNKNIFQQWLEKGNEVSIERLARCLVHIERNHLCSQIFSDYPEQQHEHFEALRLPPLDKQLSLEDMPALMQEGGVALTVASRWEDLGAELGMSPTVHKLETSNVTATYAIGRLLAEYITSRKATLSGLLSTLRATEQFTAADALERQSRLDNL
ncbi:hypothetical protein [Parendozoicomonas sp. Alg238-R29]|uniref:hypothetical protein n=1 Tax=Parendozoicomonas sp. Alg238-R29 TaxID=2993446 RepID=UPI00248F2952|nr:hypothetical protein [Parendozoicomonas sp. Alg238-R29]